MKLFKILSTIFLVVGLGCFATIFILSFTGHITDDNGSPVPWFFICFGCCFVSFILAGIFGNIAKKGVSLSGFGNNVGSSEGIDSLTKPVVKVRCPNCNALNDEDADYCKKCGASLKKHS
jgi:hypothetical protein